MQKPELQAQGLFCRRARQVPIQCQLWNDYIFKPSHEYIFTIVLIISPNDFEEGKGVSIDIVTEGDDKGAYAVFLNLGRNWRRGRRV